MEFPEFGFYSGLFGYISDNQLPSPSFPTPCRRYIPQLSPVIGKFRKAVIDSCR